MTESISVATAIHSSYEIIIGKDVIEPLAAFLRSFESNAIFVVIDENVYGHHFKDIDELLSSIFDDIHCFKVPSGESSKSFSTYQELVNFIIEQSPERATPVLAIGGGVTGDLAGFAAATVLRGLPLVHMPTTLLAMVDSSIGGKTGINHSEGKNLIGSFYQPKAVFADLNVLQTLPKKEWVNGISEILKYGMIQNPDIIGEVKQIIHADDPQDPDKWFSLICKSARIKSDIIRDDVLESGKRKFLNFGHTFAHVIESEGKYKEYSHGEAVFAGMVAAVFASNKCGANIDANLLLQFKSLYNFKLSGIKAHTVSLAEKMMKDKKVYKNELQLVLLKDVGKPYVLGLENRGVAERSWEYVLMEFQT